MNSFRVFDNLREGVQVIDHEMRYFYVNEAVAIQCRQTREEILGQRMLDKFPSLRGSEVYRKIELCMKTRKPCKMINEFEHLDGSIGWFDLRMEAVDQGVILFSFDITSEVDLKRDLKKMTDEFETIVEERTRKLEDRLRREQELNEMKVRFVSMASHQFRTPLTSIILSAALIEQFGEDIQKKEMLASHFNRIKSSANDMVAILNNFLTNDQSESEKLVYEPECIEFRVLIDEILDILSPLLKANQRFDVSVDPEHCFPSVDRYAVKTILLNLLSNAIKYSTSGSVITLRSVLDRVQLYIEIGDEGMGIPIGEQGKLFGKFFRASNVKDIQGSGLGLNIVQQFVELAKGKIHYESVEGEGTTFKVSIPQEADQVNVLA